ncbi:MAG: hypothetical protein WBH90_13430 [Aggregatilineales bacterium]|nr:hypothetical protein [Aggregatilineales bacterium]HPV08037.1 hypothetical protein [Aggregatilineales bacterium]HQE18877.1 hypothetical protein [Aggregatilineales bacterium]
MADFYQKITEQRGSLDKIARKIPGFKGYLEKEDRRAADRLLRERLVRAFEEQQTRFTRLQRDLVDAGGLQYMERVQRIDGLLQTFIDRVRTASSGYAGLTDPIKVRETELERLYAFDNALLAYQDQFAAGLEQLEQVIGTSEVGGVLRQLEDVVTEANNTFKRREEAMTGLLGGSEPPRHSE